jgi:multidrug efflux pump subunit AcrB
MKQGGDTNTIEVVNDIRKLTSKLVDIPKQLVPKVVFDQSVYVKAALLTALHEGGLGLILTSIMIRVFLGSVRPPRLSCSLFLSPPWRRSWCWP